MITWIVRGAIFVRGKKKVTKQRSWLFCEKARLRAMLLATALPTVREKKGHLITRYRPNAKMAAN